MNKKELEVVMSFISEEESVGVHRRWRYVAGLSREGSWSHFWKRHVRSEQEMDKSGAKWHGVLSRGYSYERVADASFSSYAQLPRNRGRKSKQDVVGDPGLKVLKVGVREATWGADKV